MTTTKPSFFAQLESYPSAFWVANLMEIFERMAWYGFYAVSSLYITGPVETGGLGFTSEERGAIQAVVPFFLYIFPVLTGALADRYGYKKMFIVAYVGMVISYYALGQFKTLPTFLAVFMLVAVAAAIFKPVVVGTVARVTTEKNSSMGFGIFYMMVNVGGFLGPMIAGVVRGIAWKWVFVACSIWAALNLVIVVVFYKEPTTEATSKRRRTFEAVMNEMIEVLGNLRFFICVFGVLLALVLANFEFSWFPFWPHCTSFISVWLVLNGLWDSALPRGSGRKDFPGASTRNPLLKRMHCGNWRFALFLLIMSGFWTSFNQIFLTMPEYIRDYTDTRPMVNVGRAVVGFLGKDEWLDGLAAIETPELLEEFDRLIRQAKGLEPLVPPEPPNEEEKEPEEKDPPPEPRDLADEPGLNQEVVVELQRTVDRLNAPGADPPLTPRDLVEGARTILQYKVRIQPAELGELLLRIPERVAEVDEEELKATIEVLNARLKAGGKPPLKGATSKQLEAALRDALMEHGSFVSQEAAVEMSENLSTAEHKVDAALLAVGIRHLAYRPHIWDRIDAGRQVNPEHIVNFDAGAIIFLQVLISFLMARFHRFTTMIVGMVVAAVGVGLPALAGGTMIGPVGGLFFVVAVGIVIFAIGEMMASPTSQEYVGRIAPQDRKAVYMGYYFVAIALGNLFGGILSGQMYGKLARDMQRPDLMWLAFGGLMLLTAGVFLLYNRFALPKESADTLTQGSQN